ncbi:protein of unknown function [Taphrina deformans PYCC 5710]|uniref:Uncharacterized protein n=1 Tax=Taphrina deformans (strain PYCC 5710 / ATCC 11124 / CBS 356.35 / IMI 108563 / JCM 9778 / NBRC 8474) TaxID=1097556 RepID=R4XH35_TAPDE|nr:protein of unknown function [Taphrina deformans PYCC 5710]|eukprot:CCG83833.1 protein of unknown function [Taphrina deformans PYCC 5710]
MDKPSLNGVVAATRPLPAEDVATQEEHVARAIPEHFPDNEEQIPLPVTPALMIEIPLSPSTAILPYSPQINDDSTTKVESGQEVCFQSPEQESCAKPANLPDPSCTVRQVVRAEPAGALPILSISGQSVKELEVGVLLQSCDLSTSPTTMSREIYGIPPLDELETLHETITVTAQASITTKECAEMTPDSMHQAKSGVSCDQASASTQFTSSDEQRSSVTLECKPSLELSFTPMSSAHRVAIPKQIGTVPKMDSLSPLVCPKNLSYGSRVMSANPMTPATPTTTWINGIEVPLPPDVWSPADSSHLGSPSLCVSGRDSVVAWSEEPVITLAATKTYAEAMDPNGLGQGYEETEECSATELSTIREETGVYCTVLEASSPPQIRAEHATGLAMKDATHLSKNCTSATGRLNMPRQDISSQNDSTCENSMSEGRDTLMACNNLPPSIRDEDIGQASSVLETGCNESLVPVLADDSLVEAFEHDLEMPMVIEAVCLPDLLDKTDLDDHTGSTIHVDPDLTAVSSSSNAMNSHLVVFSSFQDNATEGLHKKHHTLNGSYENADLRITKQDTNPGAEVHAHCAKNDHHIVEDSTVMSTEHDRDEDDTLVTQFRVPSADYTQLEVGAGQNSGSSVNEPLASSPCSNRLSARNSLASAEELSFIQPAAVLTMSEGMKLVNQESSCKPVAVEYKNHTQSGDSTQNHNSGSLVNQCLSPVFLVEDTASKNEVNLTPSSGMQKLAQPLPYTHTQDTETTDMQASPIVQRKKSSARRQSRRQSYMTATKSAVRERELELRQADQEQADLQLAAELLDPPESLLVEMPGSVERKRTKRRSNSASRKSPLMKQEGEVCSNATTEEVAEAESFSPVVLDVTDMDQDLLERSAVSIQACFRGWRTRQFLKSDMHGHSSEEVSALTKGNPATVQVDDSGAVDNTGKEDSSRPSSKDSNLDNVFSDFLKQWQSKKSQKAKLEDLTQISERIVMPGTPKRTLAGTLSPQKSDKKTLVVTSALPSSAQKGTKTTTVRTSRSRLPGPRTTSNTLIVASASKKAGTKLPDNRRGLSMAANSSSSLQHDSNPDNLVADDDDRGEVNKSDPARKRTRMPKLAATTSSQSSTNAESRTKLSTNSQASNMVVPTTPKRLLYLTPAEVAKTTRTFTSQNRLYRCDFDRVVVRKEIQRPPSPTAKLQAKLATNARTKRRRLMKERGYTFGAGDEEDYVPRMVTPERKAVKWGEELEVNLTSLPKTTPSKVRHIEEVASCIAPVALDDYGNVATNTPLTPELGKPHKVVITKYLYRGEQDDS